MMSPLLKVIKVVIRTWELIFLEWSLYSSLLKMHSFQKEKVIHFVMRQHKQQTQLELDESERLKLKKMIWLKEINPQKLGSF